MPRRFSKKAIPVCGAILLGISQSAQAQSSAVIYLENDIGWTDEFYTHGTKLELGFQDLSLGLGQRVFADHTTCIPQPDIVAQCYTETTRFSLGQNLYTPNDIRQESRIIGDRPYGGWLYFEALTEAVSRSARPGIGMGGGRQWAASVNVGVVGPWSMADTIQRFWHESVTVESPRPEGWEHQVSNRLAAMASADVKQRFIDVSAPLSDYTRMVRYFDVLGGAGASVGNVLTEGRVGVTTRFGFNVGDDFGPAIIGPSPVAPSPSDERAEQGSTTEPTSSPSNDRERPIWALYGFLGAEGRGVLYNVFIDPEAERHQIVRNPWVYDLTWGVAFRLGWASLNYTRVTRSREFSPNDTRHQYHAISVGWAPGL